MTKGVTYFSLAFTTFCFALTPTICGNFCIVKTNFCSFPTSLSLISLNLWPHFFIFQIKVLYMTKQLEKVRHPCPTRTSLSISKWDMPTYEKKCLTESVAPFSVKTNLSVSSSRLLNTSSASTTSSTFWILQIESNIKSANSNYPDTTQFRYELMINFITQAIVHLSCLLWRNKCVHFHLM